jgi:uncharacterized protein (TIGR02444 family)
MPNGKRTVAAKSARRNRALWPFALHLYGQEGVAVAFLELQDKHGADVPLLLAALWHGASARGVLSPAQKREWQRISARWQDDIVSPLRRARRALKPLEADAGAKRLRARVKRAELDAERLQLRLLEMRASPTQAANAARCVDDARTNLRQFLKSGKTVAAVGKIISALGRAP